MKQVRLRTCGISRRRAIDMVSRSIGQQIAVSLTCYDTPPPRCRGLYYKTTREPCWYIVAPWNDGMNDFVLRSSRLIVVGRRSGTVFYDGSAGDEG